jgi:hypothetical protein
MKGSRVDDMSYHEKAVYDMAWDIQKRIVSEDPLFKFDEIQLGIIRSVAESMVNMMEVFSTYEDDPDD